MSENYYSLSTISEIEKAIKMKAAIFDQQDREIDRQILTRGLGPKFHKDDPKELLRERFLLNMIYEDFYTTTKIE